MMKNELNIIDFFGMIKNKVFDLFKVNNNVDNDLKEVCFMLRIYVNVFVL